MEIEEKLKNLILDRYGTMVEFAKDIDMPNTTLASIINRGVHKASVTNIIKICKALDISTDELANDRIVPTDKMLPAKKPMTEIEDIITFTRINISTYSELTIDGEPLSEDDKQSLMDALEISLQLIKKRHNRNKN